MTTGTKSRFAVALGAVALFAPLVPSGATAETGPVERQRLGVIAESAVENPGDGDEITTTTPTLVVDDLVEGAEIVVYDSGGIPVIASGALDEDRWDVPEGVLDPGGSYSWNALAPTGGTTRGSGTLVLNHDLEVSGDMALGPTVVDHEVVQDPKSFSVSTGIEPAGAPSGLKVDFFPHFDVESYIPVDDDGEPVDELPPVVTPGPGSETVSRTAEWEIHEGVPGFGPKEERARKPSPGESPPPPVIFTTLEWELTDVRYGVSAEAEITADGGEVAAHNIQGRNVVPSSSTVITSDVAVEDGFVVSTGGAQQISAAFPLQTEFGFRALGHLTVPETGTYRFGTQSPGGAELVLYQPTDSDLEQTILSQTDAWWPTTLGRTYAASTTEFHFHNAETHTTSSQDMAHFYRTSHYEHDSHDPDWFQVGAEQLRGLVDDLRGNGPAADTVRWGDEHRLEGGDTYQLAFTGWVGPLGGDIGIHVDGPGMDPMAVPFEWLDAASAGTTGFDRAMDATAMADIPSVDSALSGYGDVLASLDAFGWLSFYETDGGVGWRHVGTLEDAAPSMHWDPGYSVGLGGMAFDDLGHTLAVALDRWPDPDRVATAPGLETYEPLVTEEDLRGVVTGGGDLSFLQAGSRMRLDGAREFEIVHWGTLSMATLYLDALDLKIDPFGAPAEGAVSGYLELSGEVWSLDTVAATIDEGTGELRLGFDSELDGRKAHYVLVSPHVLSEPGAAFEHTPFEVALFDKVDQDGSWTAENIETTWVSGLLDTAGIDQPSFDPNPDDLGSPYYYTGNGISDPAPVDLTVNDAMIALSEPVQIALGGASIPFSTLTGAPAPEVLLDLYQLELSRDGSTITGGAIDANYEMYQDAPYGNIDFTVDQVGGGSYDGSKGEVTVDASGPFILNGVLFGYLDWELHFTLAPEYRRVAQYLDLSTDGNTLAVLQPSGDEQRVVVVDRDDARAPWGAIGSFEVDASSDRIPIAIGRDRYYNDTRFLARATSEGVAVQEWTPAGGWRETASVPVEGGVTALGFDYYAEHLAIGQSDIGRVTTFRRDGQSSTWSHQADLDGAGTFGARVSYGWNLLGVGEPSRSFVTVYRDTGVARWSSYDDWSRTFAGSAAPELGFGIGGDPTAIRAVTTAVDLGTSSELATHRG